MGRFSVEYIDIDNANLSKDDAGGSVSVFCTKLLEQFGGAFIVNVGPVGDGWTFLSGHNGDRNIAIVEQSLGDVCKKMLNGRAPVAWKKSKR